MRVLGFDIGTTSIGFAVIDHLPETEQGRILRLGVRVFPEARDPEGTPFNQTRRQKRMARRQLRRRRQRRRALNEALGSAGLLPRYGHPEWSATMAADPYLLRKRGLSEALSPHEVGRAIYHLAKHRHFSGRELEEDVDQAEEDSDEKAAKSDRDETTRALRDAGTTLGAWLSLRGPQERKRGLHAHRSDVVNEFEALWEAQAPHHAILRDTSFKAAIQDTVFAQRPVFWRKNTLGECRFMPGEDLCPKGAWLSQQRRMLEKLNNLGVGGNARPLDEDERAAIMDRLQTQASMTWAGVRAALKPLYKARGEAGVEKRLKFNLEIGGDRGLLGNTVEAKLARVFGGDWADHPHKQAIRDAVHRRLWAADYGEIGDQRVIILSAPERRQRRAEAVSTFIADFAITQEQAKQLSEMTFPTGWEPFSVKALEAFMPHLKAGVRFGVLVNAPEWEEWRNSTFPDRDRPTGEVLDRLPSPAVREERERIAKLRNPTVVRTQNELRKVVNNLIGLYGKPDMIRVEVARDVGKSKREREETEAARRKQEKRRRDAVKDLGENGIHEPSRRDIERWLLWKESRERCPYTGDQIGFDALFREGRFDVEHIWPRWRSFDDSFRNKTLCRRDVNLEKGDRTPFEYLAHDPDRWDAVKRRLQEMIAAKGGNGMSAGKVKRFLAECLPDEFASRQLNDTGYAARQAVAFLKRLWPDVGPEAPVHVQAVTGRVTARLRELWGLNNILADNGEKTRADHRHHAIDALTVACTHPGMTNRLSRYWQAKDDPRAAEPSLPPPWTTIRADAEKAVTNIVVSHRVRKKVSGPLHKDTVYGDTGNDVSTKSGTYREFVTRKRLESISKTELGCICDSRVREVVTGWVNERGGDPKRAFPPYPRLGDDKPEIRKVRLWTRQQVRLMAPVSTGYADLGANHHIAIYRTAAGRVVFDVVSLFEAARRVARREPIVRRAPEDGAAFVMSLAPGDALQLTEGNKAGCWIVQGAWSNGQIVVENANDAAHATTNRPNAASLLARGARKVAVDPIGRVRPAND
ncbi:MAG: type II CRISPR RNA-guided endonuclease Cas9 [Rhodospirillales bacterium]|nr:type II CRISPR RNA-guided endonuclease Cas9 [Rhodospirillales bacterium]